MTVGFDNEIPFLNDEWTMVRTVPCPGFSVQFRNRKNGRVNRRIFYLATRGRTLFDSLSDMYPSDVHTIDLPAQFVEEMLA